MKKFLLSHSIFLIPYFLFSQNVGIGTTSPGTRLHVVDGIPIHIGSLLPGITLEGSGNMYFNEIAPNSQETGILFWFPSMLPRGGVVYNNSANLDGLQFRTNGNVTRMVIDNTGNVGIGTTSPIAPLSFASTLGEKISLWSAGSLNYGLGIQSGLLQIHTDGENSDIAFGHGIGPSLTERMRILNTGYNGMLLNGRLVIKNGTTDFVNGGGGVWFYKSDNSALLGFVGAQNNQNLGFYGGVSNGGWGFVYNALTGRVGIGTSNPTKLFHVVGNSYLNGTAEVSGTLEVFGLAEARNGLEVDGLTQLDALNVSNIAQFQNKVGINTYPITGLLFEVNGTAGKPGGGSWSGLSDVRMKENVMPYSDGLSAVLKITPVKYHYNQLSGYDTRPEYIGVLAQDIQTIAPYMVSSFQKNGTTYYTVENSPMTYMLINAVKEQQVLINKQQQQIDELIKLVKGH